jgi:hypothetical protein
MSKNRRILYRTDLMIHHLVCFVVYLSYIGNTTLQINNVLIMEIISAMNHVLCDHNDILKIFRTACIFCIRMPLSLWFRFYYNPNYQYSYLRNTYNYYHSEYLVFLGNIYLFFVVYDIYILWRLYKPRKIQITPSVENMKYL